MSRERRKRQSDQTADHREGLRKVIKTHSSELQCPICDVTLRADTLVQHYQQELEKLEPTMASTNTRKDSDRRRMRDGGRGEMTVMQEAQQSLEAIKRKRFLFEHPHQSHDQPGPSHQTEPSTMCDTCGIQLPTDDEQAAIHVSSCQGQPSAGSSDSEEYEEYTWCNVTRVRATSMLSAETRANIFNGTVVSKAMDGDSSFDVDVEDDSTSLYGPPQYTFSDITSVADGGSDRQGETSNEASCDLRGKSCDLQAESCDQLKTNVAKSSAQCSICMDIYTQPLVSVQCWHVFCEQCWLQALGDKKLCPKCKTITCASDLRRIFL